MSNAASAISVSPPVTVAAYSAGNAAGGVVTFVNALNYGWSGVLGSIHVTSKSVQTTGLKLYLFTAPPQSTFADKAAPSIVAADLPNLIGAYTLGSADSGLGTCTFWALDNINKVVAGQSANLYGLLTVVATPTFASVSDIAVTVGVRRDI